MKRTFLAAIFTGLTGFWAQPTIHAQVLKATYKCQAFQTNSLREWSYSFEFASRRDRDGFFTSAPSFKTNVFQIKNIPGMPSQPRFVADLIVYRYDNNVSTQRVSYGAYSPTGELFYVTLARSPNEWMNYDTVTIAHGNRTAVGTCKVTR